jgi:hypothetical protein
MSEPKTRPTDASVEAFLDAATPAQRRADGFTLLAIMTGITGEPAVMWGPSIVGFGSRPMVYASGATVDWPAVAFSPRKASLVLYIDHDADLLARLGKHKLGKGCLYITRLADVDEAVLREMIARSWTGD